MNREERKREGVSGGKGGEGVRNLVRVVVGSFILDHVIVFTVRHGLDWRTHTC